MFEDFKGAFSKPNNGLIQIILINVIVFLLLNIFMLMFKWTGLAGWYVYVERNLMLPANLSVFITRPWTLITYFFSHENIFHILSNMLFLYWFGKLIEEYLGNRRLINLYLLGGLAGGILYLLIYNLIPYYNNQIEKSVMLGASGAVYAVVVGAATLMPNYTFFMLLLGPVRIKYIAAFFLVLSFVQLSGDNNAGGQLAHLGGALLGFIFIKQLKKGTDLGQPLTALAESIKKLFAKKPAMKVTYHKKESNRSTVSSYNQTTYTPNQDEIDAILDKISRSGYESLTKEEKQKLFRASQKN
ncbi:rhomboid family intramembrane serine protease [Rhodocytophaga rosea]|uniref:Rhomboid family intramembrane serine protease n=1 Tax=Rhodocytophaga rosea TaxID=2704465 RepID=A0A6C0GJH5_9BACT|nr:rhomboid family intramembrane serine protease [Rhodocytophaga rosea]QHT67812.1 rhomboid family intramembrane serine protease [Rhodocytophaga rosea]